MSHALHDRVRAAYAASGARFQDNGAAGESGGSGESGGGGGDYLRDRLPGTVIGPTMRVEIPADRETLRPPLRAGGRRRSKWRLLAGVTLALAFVGAVALGIVVLGLVLAAWRGF